MAIPCSAAATEPTAELLEVVRVDLIPRHIVEKVPSHTDPKAPTQGSETGPGGILGLCNYLSGRRSLQLKQ